MTARAFTCWHCGRHYPEALYRPPFSRTHMREVTDLDGMPVPAGIAVEVCSDEPPVPKLCEATARAFGQLIYLVGPERYGVLRCLGPDGEVRPLVAELRELPGGAVEASPLVAN